MCVHDILPPPVMTRSPWATPLGALRFASRWILEPAAAKIDLDTAPVFRFRFAVVELTMMSASCSAIFPGTIVTRICPFASSDCDCVPFVQVGVFLVDSKEKSVPLSVSGPA